MLKSLAERLFPRSAPADALATVERQRIPSLDGLRGCAVLVVMCSHFDGLFGITKGNLGVDIFFVLSGFLITSLLLREIADTGTVSFANFYARRVLRLAPALLVCVFVFGAIDLAFGIFPRNIILRSIPAAIFYVSNWVRATDRWNMFEFGHTWSLAIEEQFYLIWPIALLFLIGRVRNFTAIFAGVLFLVLAIQVNRYMLVARGAPEMWVSAAFHTRADAIFAGALPAIIVAHARISEQFKRLLWLAAPAGVMVIILVLLLPADYLAWKQPFVVASVAVIVLHLSSNAGSRMHIAMSADWLVYTGKISYGLYLYHYPIWYLTVHKFGTALSVGEKQAIGLFILAPVSYAMAGMSFKYIETPALLMKERFRSRVTALA
ncbi:acyltransferase [Mesorhizobium sp. B2-1-3A]|uniref:acyltransferase family protein n=1 Tax=Mesorhizobium sp. B2-1-3A TaxID=2589971 RepID=UPI001127EC99|nr:acyltransferase [Mesorhizobium sp. B2-1-3A]TPM96247.1 acyltransferase [Mesorhizobium sp. B2-1-3A]